MKKFISAILLMAAMVLSVSTFVSCNDLKEDIEKVTTDTTKLQQEVTALDAALNTANENVAKAQKAADEALDAAKDAQDDADAAAKAADDLKKALANLATEQAIRDAIKAAIDEVNEKIADLKGKDEELLEAIAEVNAKIADLKIPNMPDLTPYAKNADLLALQGRITTLENTVKNYNDLITEAEVNALLKDYVKKDDLSKINSDLTELNKLLGENGEIATIKDRLTKIEEYLEDQFHLYIKNVAENAANKVLKSIAYVPEAIDDQLNEIEDGFLTFKRCTAADEDVYTYLASSCVEFAFRVNPADAKLTKEELSFIANEVTVKASADSRTVLEVVSVDDDSANGDGRYIVTARAKADLLNAAANYAANTKATLVALQVSNENYIVTSDYVAIADKDVKSYVIRNPKNDAEYFNTHWHVATPAQDDAPYKAHEDVNQFYPDNAHNQAIFAGDVTPIQMQYDKTLDLNEYVKTYCSDLGTGAYLDDDVPCIDVNYKFTPIASFIGADGVTDQQLFIECTNGVVKVAPHGDIAGAVIQTAIGKTPVIMVESYIGEVKDENKVAKAYIKIDIKEEVVEVKHLDPITITLANTPYKYTNLVSGPNYHTATTTEKWATGENGTSANISWTELTTEVLSYTDVYLSNEQFIANYYVDNTVPASAPAWTTEVKVDNVVTTYTNSVSDYEFEPYAVGGPVGATTTTVAKYNLNSYIDENCNGTVTLTITTKDDTKYPTINIEFPFTVSHEMVWPAYDPDYAVLETAAEGEELYSNTGEKLVQIVKGHQVTATGFTWKFETYLKEAFKPLATGTTNSCGKNHGAFTFALANATEDRAVLTPGADWTKSTINIKVADPAVASPAMILNNFNTSDWSEAGRLIPTGDVTTDGYLVWDNTGAMDIPVTLTTILDNAHKCQMTYYVRFVNPFSAELATMTLETLPEGVKCYVPDYLTVKIGNELVYKEGAYAAGTNVVITHDFSVVNTPLLTDNIMGLNTFTYGIAQNRLNWNREYIYWNNGGSELQNTKNLDASLYIFNNQVGWFPITSGTGKVVLKKSATAAE